MIISLAALIKQANELGIRFELSHSVIGFSGQHGIKSVEVAHNGSAEISTITWDALLMAGGWTPSIQL